MSGQRLLVWVVIGLAGGGLAAWLWLSGSQPSADAPAAQVSPVAVAPPGTGASAPAAAAAEAPPAAVAEVQTALAEPALAASDIAAALTDLLGGKAVQSFLQTEDFPRRFVATVDNLGRAHAPPLMWPVNPTAGRFLVEQRDGATLVNADNALRYTPFVLLAETVDIGRTVALYRRMSPLLQQAYVDLGFPGRSFDARLVEVIDLLLATPQAPERLPVTLTEVRGSVPSTRPWVRYEFADPALESLASGQKMLIRTGVVNQRRLKAKLSELRSALLASGIRR